MNKQTNKYVVYIRIRPQKTWQPTLFDQVNEILTENGETPFFSPSVFSMEKNLFNISFHLYLTKGSKQNH